MTEPVKTRRKKPSALPSIMSLTLVLFMLGLLGTSVLAYEGIVRNLVEESYIDLYFQDSVSEKTAREFEASLKTKPWLKKTVFISREAGFQDFSADKRYSELAEFSSAEQMPHNLEIYFKADHAGSDKIANTARTLEADPLIEAVVYQPKVIEMVSENVKKGQWILIGLAVIFCFISIGLINSSTRLSIFANRFLIKSMQLVGATNGFITRPLIWKFMKYALLAIPIAALLLLALAFGLHRAWPDAVNYREIIAHIAPAKALLVYGSIIIFGIILAVGCVWLSTRKYLRTKIENLY